MKKIFYLFTIISAFLTGCSSEDLSTTGTDKEATYPINFKIANPLAVEGTPFRSSSAEDMRLDFLEMGVFNESGDLLMNFMFNKNNQSAWLQPDGTAQIGLSLPKGVYYIYFFTIKDLKISNIARPLLTDPIYNKDDNYFTSYVYTDAINCYYESIATTVAPTNQTIEQNITLKPMWSNLNLTLNDAQTFNAPEGTDALQFVVSPLYVGFHLNTKLATDKVSENWVSIMSKYKTNTISLDEIRANATFTYPTYVYQTLPENGNLAIKVNYLKTKNTTDTIVLKTRELQIPDITIENGYNYNISGKLDAGNGQSMNISLGEFNKEDVVIEF